MIGSFLLNILTHVPSNCNISLFIVLHFQKVLINIKCPEIVIDFICPISNITFDTPISIFATCWCP